MSVQSHCFLDIYQYWTSRSGVRRSTTESPRSPSPIGTPYNLHVKFNFLGDKTKSTWSTVTFPIEGNGRIIVFHTADDSEAHLNCRCNMLLYSVGPVGSCEIPIGTRDGYCYYLLERKYTKWPTHFANIFVHVYETCV